MSKGDIREQLEMSDINEYNYDASSVQILLDTETQNKSKYRKLAIGIGVAVICSAFVLCIILLSSKSDNDLNLAQRNNTDSGRPSSSTQNTSIKPTNYDKGMKNKKSRNTYVIF